MCDDLGVPLPEQVVHIQWFAEFLQFPEKHFSFDLSSTEHAQYRFSLLQVLCKQLRFALFWCVA